MADPDWEHLTEALLKRSGGYCEACGRVLVEPWERHHRKLRSAGGGHHLANLLALCQDCHRSVHGGPQTARDRGWIVSRYSDPARVPATLPGIGRRLLDDYGNHHPWPPAALHFQEGPAT